MAGQNPDAIAKLRAWSRHYPLLGRFGAPVVRLVGVGHPPGGFFALTAFSTAAVHSPSITKQSAFGPRLRCRFAMPIR